MNIYVGNLSYKVTEEELRNLFQAHGDVASVRIISDYDGRSKGFAFVEMPDETQAKEAIQALNGKELGERALAVNEARPRTERSGGGGNRGGGGGGGRSRGGGGGGGGGRGGHSGGGGGNRGRGSRF